MCDLMLLLYINQHKLVHFQLQHNSDGYLVIIQPRFKDLTCMAETVMGPEKYQQFKEGRLVASRTHVIK